MQNAVIGGQATYDGRIVFTNLPDTIVDDALPPDLALASNPTSQPSLHPVLLIFGHQRDTKWVLPLYDPPIGEDYNELIAIIPFVVKAGGGSLWHNYVVRIYLDNDVARYIGNLYFGLMKRKANFVETSTTVDVNRRGARWFQASASNQGSWMSNVSAEQSLPNWRAVEAILNMPVLGTLIGVPGKPHVCTYFEWHYDQAQVRTVVSQHAFLQPFTAGVTSWQAQGTLQSVTDGAFEIQGLQGRMAFPPIPCVL